MASPRGLKAIPRAVWALGFVSLFMDASSELIHSLLPVFMVSALGASITSVGAVEGIAEATALITRIFSGTLSDYFGRRKLLTALGYALAACSKPLFPLAHTVGMVLLARFADRVGKGIRGAPRDALIGEIAPPGMRGACFGLRQAMDTVGAFIGPLLAMLLMAMLAENMRQVLWLAVIPAVISVIILVFGVREPEKPPGAAARSPLRLRDIPAVGGAFWRLAALGALLTLARSSEAFLVLRGQSIGLTPAAVPVVMVVMNVVYAAAAYPAGVVSDRLGRRGLLLFGAGFLMAAELTLGVAGGMPLLMLGVCLWGLHLGFTQGVLAAMVADITPARLRGTAYGVFNFVCGVAILVSSVTAGALWDGFGPRAAFLAGAMAAGVAGLSLWRMLR